MQLTLFTDYSLRALIYLAERPDRLCTAREIAEAYAISQNHMVKVVHRLTTLGYVQGRRGFGGGLKLSRPPEEINIGELVARLEPDFNLATCFNSDAPSCVIAPSCRLKGLLARALHSFMQELGSATLADLVPLGETLFPAPAKAAVI